MTVSLKYTAVLASLALIVPLSASAASGAAKELSTAAEHAGYAAKAGSVNEMHLHLHHTINCLVGPKGKGYAAKFEDPCKGEGDGALNDMSGASAKKKKSVKNALSLAETGLTMKSLQNGHDTAQTVEKLLKGAE